VPGGNRVSPAPEPEVRKREPVVGVLGMSDIATVATSSALDRGGVGAPNGRAPDCAIFAPHVRQKRLLAGSSVEHDVQRIILNRAFGPRIGFQPSNRKASLQGTAFPWRGPPGWLSLSRGPATRSLLK
jgi:hypothetical protein